MKLYNLLVNFFRRIFSKQNAEIQTLNPAVNSTFLDARIDLIIHLPPNYSKKKTYPVLLFNDGQDLSRMDFKAILAQRYQEKQARPHIVVGVVPKDRIAEYGTVTLKDYKNRGEKSQAYHDFINKELFPYLYEAYNVSRQDYQHSIAGFSLGGLSAIYIAWQYPKLFKSVGVFSGALWWRNVAFDENNPDADPIMHQIIAKSSKRKHLKLWFQAGTKDEEADRNNNGIIDAIDDTLDLMKELRKIGYTDDEIRYVEIQDGEHEPITWGKAMPDFLEWAVNI